LVVKDSTRKQNKKIFMYITSDRLETFSTISDINLHFKFIFFNCTIGCSIILTYIVKDIGSHKVHTCILPCICSALV